MKLRAEATIARQLGLPWQERGPLPEMLPEGQMTWRGQQYRPNTGKWANRGGSHKQWYTDFYKAKKAGPEAVARLEPRPEDAVSSVAADLRPTMCGWRAIPSEKSHAM